MNRFWKHMAGAIRDVCGEVGQTIYDVMVSENKDRLLPESRYLILQDLTRVYTVNFVACSEHYIYISREYFPSILIGIGDEGRLFVDLREYIPPLVFTTESLVL